MIPLVCAWCLEAGRLVMLNDATWEQALEAMEDRSLSHGICESHAEAYRRLYGLTEATR